MVLETFWRKKNGLTYVKIDMTVSCCYVLNRNLLYIVLLEKNWCLVFPEKSMSEIGAFLQSEGA